MIAGADARALRAMMGDRVAYGGLWFDDADCRKQFTEPRMLPATELDAFARCVAGLHLRVANNVHMIPDVAVLDYDPGLEVETEIAVGPHRRQILTIGFLGSFDTRGWLPAITEDALESLRIAGGRDDHDAATRKLLDAAVTSARDGVAMASYRVCIGRDGTVTSAHLFNFGPDAATVLGREIARWRFRPFMLGGTAMPACAQTTLSYPSGAFRRVWTLGIPSLDPSTEGNPIGERIAGDAEIMPDDPMKWHIVPGSRFVAVVRFCHDETGRMTDVKLYEPSGLIGYDQKIVETIKRWRYQPAIVEGRPLRACGALTFIYRMH